MLSFYFTSSDQYNQWDKKEPDEKLKAGSKGHI